MYGLIFPFPCGRNCNYSVGLHVVYVKYISLHVLCHLGLIFFN